MDVKVSKHRIRKERLVFILKCLSYLAVLLFVIYIVSLLIEPKVDSRQILLATADRGDIELTLPATGKVVPAFEQIINSPISSKILKVHSQAGSILEKGSPILELDLSKLQSDYLMKLDKEQMTVLELEKLKLQNQINDSESQTRLNVKKIELENIELEYSNQRYLDSLGASTTAAVRKARMNYEVAQMQYQEELQLFENRKALAQADQKIRELNLSIFRKELEQLKITLEQARIESPQAAVLSYVATNIGSQVGAGEKIAIISDLNNFKIEAQISDYYRTKLTLGGVVHIIIESEILEGIISNINPVSINGAINFTVQLEDSDNMLLRSGLRCETYVLESLEIDAIRIKNGKHYKGAGVYDMFVKKGDYLEKRKVRLGDCNYDFVEIISGVLPGEQVLLSELNESQKSKDKLKIK